MRAPSPRRAQAPGRANLVGEHTDYNGGLCLPIALDLRTTVDLAWRSDDRVLVTSDGHGTWQGTTADLRPGGAPGWAAYAVGALAEVAPGRGVSLEVSSTVPSGAGLSSSAAVICAVARAASTATAEELVGPCIAAEVRQVGASTGGLDQTVSLLAHPGHALLLDFDAGTREHVPWAPETDGVQLLVVDTRAVHSHVDGGYAHRRAECEQAAALLGVPLLARATAAALEDLLGAPQAPGAPDPEVLHRRARHVVSECARVRDVVAAAAVGEWDRVGELFTASHASLRDDFEVSWERADAAVDSALRAGALGARMTGGGFGGSVLVLTRDPERTARAVRETFGQRGWERPDTWPVTAGPGARVLGTT